MSEEELGAAMAVVAKRENELLRMRMGYSVAGREVARKYKPRALTAPLTEVLQPYLGTGIAQRELARKLGCSSSSISHALKRMGATL